MLVALVALVAFRRGPATSCSLHAGSLPSPWSRPEIYQPFFQLELDGREALETSGCLLSRPACKMLSESVSGSSNGALGDENESKRLLNQCGADPNRETVYTGEDLSGGAVFGPKIWAQKWAHQIAMFDDSRRVELRQLGFRFSRFAQDAVDGFRVPA